jgi:uncharacterized RDD family membrane protein YckC
MTMPTSIPPGMGQCEITGNIVPEDELVVLNGQRVCAQGKAILLDRLKAGEAMPGEAERPTVLRRFGCIFLDGMILGVPGVIFNVIFSMGAAAAGSARFLIIGLAQVAIVGISILYFTLMHGTRGQTVGKIAGKLKVVRIDDKPMDMRTALIRALAYQGAGVISAILLMVTDAVPTAMVWLPIVGSSLVGIYGLVNVLFALVDRSQQRALHDRIAGTRVIMFAR